MVQGVGFRPLVYSIAQKYGLQGAVRNVGGYAEIFIEAEAEAYDSFLCELRDRRHACEIIKIEEEELSHLPAFLAVRSEKAFIILDSEENEEFSVLPPDLPVCEDCIRELYDGMDRRYLNPFISCTHCGPRYTIIEKLPYDRENTSMSDFALCASCSKEYTAPESRRHHAQTISCNDCGPYLIYRDLTGTSDNPRNLPRESYHMAALEEAIRVLKTGGILAVKGIGGYHLVCSPFLKESVEKLRKLKGREQKPFAVMFDTPATIREYCTMSVEEQRLLETKARPICLLYMHRNSFAPSVTQGSIYCGAFLPYTPLQLLLTKECGPLIMTSANLSGQPIIRNEKNIFTFTSPFLSGVLYHHRRIVRSVDDSVAKMVDGRPQLIRRSRGYVPYPVFLPVRAQENFQIFAAGGDLKAAFCLFKNKSAVVSQYLGDLEEEAVMEEYVSSGKELSALLKINPTHVVCDLHPNYFSSRYAKGMGLPVLEVQHHHAHIASVMAEHALEGKVIGIAFDGTGYGTDGAVWGGEFLLCEGANYHRAAKLRYMSILGGDESMKDAQKTASCYLYDCNLTKFCRDERLPVIKAALKQKVNTILTSSMGRLFDAVAALLDISRENRYEGECAIRLEAEAVLALRQNILPAELSFAIEEKDGIIEIDSEPVLREIVKGQQGDQNGSSVSERTLADQNQEMSRRRAYALGFHYAIADMMVKVCERLRVDYKTDTIALSGGVFQNTVLTERACRLLRERGFSVYYNLAVPPNDGCISLGQVYIALRHSWQEKQHSDFGLILSSGSDRKGW